MRSYLYYFRIACTAFCGITAVLLVVLWVRSQNRIDRITWHYDNAKAFQVGTLPGAFDLNLFVDRPIPVPRSLAARPWMTEWFESMQYINGETYWWFAVLSGNKFHSVVIPNWFLMLSCCGFGSVPWLPWSKRFSLRTLLLAMTLVAVVLGVLVWMVRN